MVSARFKGFLFVSFWLAGTQLSCCVELVLKEKNDSWSHAEVGSSLHFSCRGLGVCPAWTSIFIAFLQRI